ncbi:MAG: hypothetical protein A3J79_05550, partial [Elusimicrobia bacterium RIFOXYB2_FULL_62_6]
MIKKIFLMLAAAAVSVPPAFAQIDFDRGAADLGGLLASQEIPAVQAPAQAKGLFGWGNNNSAPAQPKEWTVMVYMNGKNDLEVAGLYNLNKMELAGSNDSLNIVTEIGRMNGQENDVSFDGNWTGSRRYYVTQDSNEEKIKSKKIQSFDKVDMGDWKHLADFAKWAKTNYPARRYALIVWNHGSGWVTTKGRFVNKGISYDFETKNHISTPELGLAMKEIGKVDILGYDACLMQMAEVVYETKDYADFVVASEETVPGTGFPYDAVLKSFAPSRSTEELANSMVSAFDGFYSLKGKKVTLSSVKVSELGGFMASFNGWTDALLAFDKKPELKKRWMLSASYADKDNKDLYDFAGRLAADYPQDPVGVKSAELMSALTGKLVVSNTAYK